MTLTELGNGVWAYHGPRHQLELYDGDTTIPLSIEQCENLIKALILFQEDECTSAIKSNSAPVS